LIPFLSHERIVLLHGDSMKLDTALPENSVDAVVTDPPYELGFMGKSWDNSGIAYSVEFWKQVLRVLKPGGHLLAFGATRNYHRMACAIEDAGFEIRDSLHWMFGTGFPKSLNVSKAIDTSMGIVQPTVYVKGTKAAGLNDQGYSGRIPDYVTSPVSATAQKFAGWGTALKPSHEPIVLARKPLIGTVAANIAAHGTGGLNIDGCRIAHASEADRASATPQGKVVRGNFAPGEARAGHETNRPDTSQGRWPSNVLLDEDAARELDAQSGISKSKASMRGVGLTGSEVFGAGDPNFDTLRGHNDSGGVSRFFYVSKPSRAERDLGCAHLPVKSGAETLEREEGSAGLDNPRAGSGRTGGARNTHPTVKPIALMRYLVRLVTPPGGTVLDPFLGSGTTGIAALLEGFNFLGVELTEEYLPIITARIAHALEGGK
jgi:DNA modification methylase